VQAELTQAQGEMAQMQTALTQSQRDLGSRDAEVARLTAAVQRLEEQLHSMGITPVTGAGPSGFGQTSSPPPTDPVTRDWFFVDPPSTMYFLFIFVFSWGLVFRPSILCLHGMYRH
jgi:hypothetical protein